ncbi:hypothetical protein PIB30_016939 [Stylosanthes scabra]|uniref:Late embryogenesis abundant protein LEA-2 subgroup domain-containing protein n=1 Tax=Stylosanthes scabra TaxID=79078 RepID=A0ABU6X9C8_9FABA|nr:hypothetical protein [Stylosanthes scabra]
MEPLHITITTAPPRSSSRTRSLSLCVRMAKRLTVLLFLIMMLIMLIAWSYLKPRPPGFQLRSVSVSNFTVTDSQLIKGSCEVDLNITNPNKRVDVTVDHFIFFVSYDDSTVVSEPEPALLIYAERMRETDVKVELSFKDTLPSPIQKNMVKDLQKKAVNFNVKLKARVTYEGGIWGTQESFLDIYCGDLDVDFFSVKDTGKFLGGVGNDCDVTALEEDQQG